MAIIITTELLQDKISNGKREKKVLGFYVENEAYDGGNEKCSQPSKE